MPSDLQVSNLKDLTGSNTGLSIASDGQVSITQNNPTITLGSNATGFTGVKIADQWRLVTSFTGVATPITNVDLNKLERVDTAGQGTLGSAMTVDAGGIFTFPSTGLYLLIFNSVHQLNNSTRYIGTNINGVISGSSTELIKAYSHIYRTDSNATYAMNCVHTVFDCTNTSTDKVSFGIPEMANTDTETMGSSVSDFTGMKFIRLGDT